MPHSRTARKILHRRVKKRLRHALARKSGPVDRKALTGRLIDLLATQIDALEARASARADAATLSAALSRLTRL